jgi:DNA-binding transcriptional MerR regulator
MTRDELVELSGISYRSLGKFEEFGFISPSIRKTKGKTEKQYAARDLEKIQTMLTLLGRKLDLKEIFVLTEMILECEDNKKATKN